MRRQRAVTRRPAARWQQRLGAFVRAGPGRPAAPPPPPPPAPGLPPRNGPVGRGGAEPGPAPPCPGWGVRWRGSRPRSAVRADGRAAPPIRSRPASPPANELRRPRSRARPPSGARPGGAAFPPAAAPSALRGVGGARSRGSRTRGSGTARSGPGAGVSRGRSPRSYRGVKQRGSVPRALPGLW